MSIKSRKRVWTRGAAVLLGVVVSGLTAGAAMAQEGTTTTSTVPTTTTTTAVPQTTAHGESTDNNRCTSTLVPPLQAPTVVTVVVRTILDGFPQPHLGDKVTLSNTKLIVTVPKDIIQAGLNAHLITPGMQVASVADYVITGAGTTEGSHTFHITATSTITVDGAGKAMPVVATATLPNTTWTPINDTTPVVFTEKSLLIVATLDLSDTLGDVVVDTFVCVPSQAPTILSLGAQGPPPVVTTTTLEPLATTVAPTTTGTPSSVAVAPTALPRTGSTSSLLFVIAVGCLSAGLFAVKAASRKRVRH